MKSMVVPALSEQNTIIQDGKLLLPKFYPSSVEIGGGRTMTVFDSQQQQQQKRQINDETKIPAIFLNGFPDNAISFRLVAPILVDSGRRCLIFSCPGYDTTSNFSSTSAKVNAIAEDYIMAIQTILGKGARFHLVGHDWGSVHASCIARKLQDKDNDLVVASLVLAAVPHGTIAGFKKFTTQFHNSWYIAFFQLPYLPKLWLRRGNGLLYLWQRWSPNLQISDHNPYFQSVHRSLLEQAGVLRSALQIYRDVMGFTFLINFVIIQLVFGFRWMVGLGNQSFELPIKVITKEEREEQDAYFKMPVMGMYGETDGCIDPRIFELTMATTTDTTPTYRSGCTLVKVSNAGHFLFSEQPEVVGSSLQQFMGKADDLSQ